MQREIVKMLEAILFTSLIAVILYGIKKAWSVYRRLQMEMQREWRQVPPPVWAAKRGGRDYW